MTTATEGPGGLVVNRRVVADMVRLAAEEVPGVLRLGRHGPGLRARLAGPAVSVSVHEGRVSVRVVLIARPGHRLPGVANQVRTAVAAACVRLLGLEPAEISVLIDGVGA